MTYALHLGSCLDPLTGMASLADGSVDHFIFDPPYSEHVHHNLGREDRNDATAPREALGFSSITAATATVICCEAARLARRWVLLFCDERAHSIWEAAIAAAGLDYVRLGAWLKTDAMPQMSGDRPASGLELIVIAHAPRDSGRMRWNGGGRAARWSGPCQERTVERQHPAQKPEWLASVLVRDFTDPGETILDPFAGSGTTGVACIRMGRNFIGWEKDPTFHAAALRRLAGTVEQPELCLGKPKKAKQDAMTFDTPTPEAT